MASDKALKQPLLEKANGKWDDEQEEKKVTKKHSKSIKKAAADEQEVADVEQGATEEEAKPEPAKKAAAKKKPATEVDKEEPEVKPAAKKKPAAEVDEEEPEVKPVAKKKPAAEVEEEEPEVKAVAKKKATTEVEEEEPEAKAEQPEEKAEKPEEKAEKPVKLIGKSQVSPRTEFKAAGDVALLAASPHLEHAQSANWSEKNEKVLQDWKLEVANKIKECDAEAKKQANLGRGLVIPATILGAMTTASSSLSALVKNTPALSYAAAAMSLVLTILTALHTSLNPEKQVQAYLIAKDKYVTIKNKIEATLAIDVEQRGDTGAHFILEIQGLLDKADDSINQISGDH